MKCIDIPLNKSDLTPSPIDLFAIWFKTAHREGENEPSAMTLATTNQQHDVTARMVLLKSFDNNGFVFFTNYLSPKAQFLKEVPKAAAVFWWPICQRQVRITGSVILLDEKSSDDYFAQRSKESQIAAIVSKQSEIIPDRQSFLKRYEAKHEEYESLPHIDRPEYWGGYVLQPQCLEFWQGRAHRIHDRFQYNKVAEGWEIVQLSP